MDGMMKGDLLWKWRTSEISVGSGIKSELRTTCLGEHMGATSF
jgi:hypothetical protein